MSEFVDAMRKALGELEKERAEQPTVLSKPLQIERLERQVRQLKAKVEELEEQARSGNGYSKRGQDGLRRHYLCLTVFKHLRTVTPNNLKWEVSIDPSRQEDGIVYATFGPVMLQYIVDENHEAELHAVTLDYGQECETLLVDVRCKEFKERGEWSIVLKALSRAHMAFAVAARKDYAVQPVGLPNTEQETDPVACVSKKVWRDYRTPVQWQVRPNGLYGAAAVCGPISVQYRVKDGQAGMTAIHLTSDKLNVRKRMNPTTNADDQAAIDAFIDEQRQYCLATSELSAKLRAIKHGQWTDVENRTKAGGV